MVGPGKVLIVEDESVVQFHLRVIVEELGYVVSGTATSAAEALASAKETTPQLVLMDIGLRGELDGIEAARTLKDEHDLAVVFLTAFADEETVGRSQAVGASGYVLKPFNKPQLRAALSTAMTGLDNMRRAQRSEDVLGWSLDGETPGPSRVGPARAFGEGSRVAVYSHDSFGLGHLQRCLNISRLLGERFPGSSTLLMTGSPAAHRYALPEGVDYLKLPAVQKVAAEGYSARSLGLPQDDMVRLRAGLILRTIQEYRPHVLLVDHSPHGMGGELKPTLEWLQKHAPGTVKVMGLRDVVDDPETVVSLWEREGAYDTFRRLYDHLLVYGSEEVFDFKGAYQLPPDVAAKTHYCNYVRDQVGVVEPLELERTEGMPLVVVTVGGGDGESGAVLGTYLEMLTRYRNEIPFESVLLPGPFAKPEMVSMLQEASRSLPFDVCEFVPSSSPYMAASDLVIATCGYNTMTQALCHGKRAIIIPRVLYRKEQLLRAQRMEALGLVRCLPPDRATPSTLR